MNVERTPRAARTPRHDRDQRGDKPATGKRRRGASASSSSSSSGRGKAAVMLAGIAVLPSDVGSLQGSQYNLFGGKSTALVPVKDLGNDINDAQLRNDILERRQDFEINLMIPVSAASIPPRL